MGAEESLDERKTSRKKEKKEKRKTTPLNVGGASSELASSFTENGVLSVRQLSNVLSNSLAPNESSIFPSDSEDSASDEANNENVEDKESPSASNVDGATLERKPALTINTVMEKYRSGIWPEITNCRSEMIKEAVAKKFIPMSFVSSQFVISPVEDFPVVYNISGKMEKKGLPGIVLGARLDGAKVDTTWKLEWKGEHSILATLKEAPEDEDVPKTVKDVSEDECKVSDVRHKEIFKDKGKDKLYFSF